MRALLPREDRLNGGLFFTHEPTLGVRTRVGAGDGRAYNRTVMSRSTVTRQESRPTPIPLSVRSRACVGGGAPVKISTVQRPQ